MADSMLKIIECNGFTKEEAFKNLKFDPNSVIPGCNATQAWHKAGCPNVNSNAFKRFVIDQLEKKTKNAPGLGIHIVIEPPIRDTRKHPYVIINNKTPGTRDWKIIYEIREDQLDMSNLKEPIYDEYGDPTEEFDESVEISVIQPGPIVEVCDSKAEALDKMKELITATHKCYSLKIVKVPNLAPLAAFGFYRPSSGSKEGTYIACGIEKES